MQKSKLTGRLKLLKPDELRNFTRFLESPFYNKDEKIIRLFKYLKKYYPVFEDKELDREHAAAKIFPEWKSSHYKKISYLMTHLSSLVDDYFTVKEIEKQPFEREQLLLKAYKDRGGDWFFNSLANEMSKKLNKSKERGINYYQHQYRLNQEIYTHTATAKLQTGISSLKEFLENLDAFYFSSKFLYSAEMRFRELYFAEKSELILLDDMLEKVKHKSFEDKHLVHVFCLIIHLYQTRDETVYNELKALIFQHFHTFSKSEQLEMILMANNFSIMEFNQGKTEYALEIFKLYQYGLEHNVWIAEGYINNDNFDNIVNTACLVGKFDWAKTFINHYSQYLREEIKETTRLLGLSRIAFEINDFEETINLLRSVEFIDIHDNIRAKRLQIRCYYELDNYHDTFEDACNAFAQYCRRNKIMGQEIKSINLTFINFIRKLHHAKHYMSADKNTLLADLDKGSLPFTKWFRKKIEHDLK